MTVSRRCKVSVCFLIVVLATLCFASTAFASDSITTQADNTERHIMNLISVTTLKADNQLEGNETRTDAVAESSRNASVLTVQFDERTSESIDSAVERMVDLVNRIAEKLINRAADHGIILESEYVPVTINGKTYYIDPLKFAY